MVETVKIMDIPFVKNTKDGFLKEEVIPKIVAEKKCFIVTANPEIVMETRENPAYKSVVENADYVVPDGMGILIAARLQRQPLEERIAGVEVMEELLEYANENKLRCFFLGGKEEVNTQAIQNIRAKFPDLIVAGGHHGYFDIADEAVADQVLESKPDIIFAALGFPKQEFWIARYMEAFEKGVFIGVGGSIDVYAGSAKRAPQFWIRLNLEWLYRLIKQPFRWKRILKVFQFLWLIIFRR